MNYSEALEYLYSKLPMFTRDGSSAYKKDLHNIIQLCEAIGNPHKQLKYIHIAGTNGKGSTSHMLASILQSAGYKTGLYTSPHVYDFRERIRLNGKKIRESFVADFIQQNRNCIEQLQPSFFEVTVAMAFQYFANENIDIAVIETGLGGRLDSTNIITPELAVITNIGMDHTDLLGDTVSAIAKEKAGIIKKMIPVVIGETTPETKELFNAYAHSLSSNIYFAEEEFNTGHTAIENNILYGEFTDRDTQETIKIRCGLTGLYQIKNIRTVLSVVKTLRKDKVIPTFAIQEGIMRVNEQTGISGRWQMIHKQPAVIIDVAHNTDGFTQVLNQLKLHHPNAQYHFILGFVKDKKTDEIFSMLPTHASYYFTNAHIPRALSHSALKEKAAEAGINGESYDDVNLAISAALLKADVQDIIIICGSFFIISEIKEPIKALANRN